jgi:hypothetical protein
VEGEKWGMGGGRSVGAGGSGGREGGRGSVGAGGSGGGACAQ